MIDEARDAKLIRDVRARDASRRLGRDETDEERRQREAEDAAADAAEHQRAEFKATLRGLAAELAEAREKLPPAEFARLHLGVIEEVKAFLAEIAAERRTQNLNPLPRLIAALQRCDEMIDQYRQYLTALLPEPGGGKADMADVADDDQDWRTRAGLASGPPPRKRQRRLGKEAPVDAQRAKSHFPDATQKYSEFNSAASAVAETEDFCAQHTGKFKAGLSVELRPALRFSSGRR